MADVSGKAAAAAIDIGTNSVKVTVGRRGPDGAVEVLRDRTAITRLGKGVAAGGSLDPEAVRRTLEALADFALEARSLGAHRIAAVGTSALRDAQDGPQFVEQARHALNGTVEVISGDREAQLVYTAGRRDPQLAPLVAGAGTLVTMDIGGGSTEFVVGSGDRVTFQTSLQLGAVRLTERAGFSDPPTAEELARAEAIADEALAAVPAPEGGVVVVASGGTVANLVAMERKAADPGLALNADAIHAFRLTLAQIEARLAQLASLPLDERRRVPGLEPDRADVIVAGAVVQARALRRLGVSDLLASARGVRFGLLYELLDSAG